LGLTGYLGVRAQRAESRATHAEGILAAQEKERQIGQGFIAAQFVRLEGNVLTYRLPRNSTVNGDVFVEYDEQTAELANDVQILGLGTGEENGRVALSKLPMGANIKLNLSTDTNL